MPAGYSGSYGFNGTKLTLQPSKGQWESKDILGRDGSGRAIYPSMGDFTLIWGIMSTSEFKQLNDYFLYVSNTGTIVSDLPKWGDVDYLFYSYSGTLLNRPSVGSYFSEYVEDVRLLITNIRVS